MQSEATTPTPTEPYPWIKAMFGIIDYLKDKHGKNLEWFKTAIRQSNKHPKDRKFGEITPKRKHLSDPYNLLSKDLKHKFNDNDEENAKQFVQVVFPHFLNFEIHYIDSKPDLSKIQIVKDIHKEGDIYLYIIDFKSDPEIIDPVYRQANAGTKKLQSNIEEYIACYLYRPQVPLIGFITLTWEKKKSKQTNNLIGAVLVQYVNEKVKERIFTSVDNVPRVNKNYLSKDDLNDGYIYYITFKEINESPKEPLLFQVIVDINIESHNIIFGSFASFKEEKTMTPSSGWVVLIKANKDDYDNTKNTFKSDVIPNLLEAEKITKQIWAAQYFLLDKILTIQNSFFKTIDDLPTNNNWKSLYTKYVGIYKGSFHTNKSNNDSNSDELVKEKFALKILQTGICFLYIKNSNSPIKGIVRVDNAQLNFSFSYQDKTASHKFKFVVYMSDTSRDKKNIGVFNGEIPYRNYSSFISGIISIEKEAETETRISIETEIETGSEIEVEVEVKIETELILKRLIQGFVSQETINSKQQKLLVDEYNDFLTTDNKGFTDAIIIKNLLKNSKPVDIDSPSKLQHMSLALHYKYFTFRTPKTEEPGTDDEDFFRIEKCDLVFHNNYMGVTVRSEQNSYEGKTYYNGRVLLMILNPNNTKNIEDLEDQIYTDSYFIIQIVLPYKRTKPACPDMLFGTSMWQGDTNLEAKMVTLVKAHVDKDNKEDHETDSYSLGTHGEPDMKLIKTVLEEDEKYSGALSYLIGRTNRHVRASSSHKKIGMYRPRDKYNREPFFLAALYSAHMAEKLTGFQRKEFIKKTKRYLFEAYMHQYGAATHAGILINDDFYFDDPIVMARIKEIQHEQQNLKSEIDKLTISEIKDFAAQLWNYIKIEKT